MKYFLLPIIVLGVLSWNATFVFAETTQRIYFEVAHTSVAPFSEIELPLFIGSRNAINAFDIEVKYPERFLEFTGFSTRGSLVDIWQGTPMASPEGKISFRGGMFKAFQGERGLLVFLQFRARENGVVNLSTQGQFFIADGKGTVETIPITETSFTISADASVVAIKQVKDMTPPEFSDVFITDLPAQGGKVLTFRSIDKDSDIVGTFFRTKNWFSWSEWREVKNPVVIPPGAMILQLKTTNSAGQATIMELYVWSEIFIRLMVIFLLIIGVIVFVMYYNKQRRLR